MARKLSPTSAQPGGWQAVTGAPYLYRRAGSRKLYARVRIPPGAGIAGSHRARSLRTESVSEARAKLPHVVADLKGEIERARREASGHLKPASRRRTPEEEAAWWRERLTQGDPQAADELAEAMEERQGPPVGEARDDATGLVEPVYDPEREREALLIFGLATGDRLPVALHLEAFLKAKAASATYSSRVRLAARELAAWLKTQPEGDNLQKVGRRCAAAFIDHLGTTGRHAATLRSLVSALSAYWVWLKRRGELKADNPWESQDMPRARRTAGDAKRPFTDEEVTSLLAGETTRTLHDLMRLAALSGMRLNEIGRLRVGDCAGEAFAIQRSKTDAGVRVVPIHSNLKALVARRCAGKAGPEPLLEELRAAPSHPEEPARKAAERFTAYRRLRGVGDAQGDRSHSRADFHSFRRWFITKAEQAGQPPHLISAVVGHEEGRKGMTLSVYSAGPSQAQLRAVVEAVALPAGAPRESPEGPLLGSGRRTRPLAG